MNVHILKKILTGKGKDYKNEIPTCTVYLKDMANIRTIEIL